MKIVARLLSYMKLNDSGVVIMDLHLKSQIQWAGEEQLCTIRKHFTQQFPGTALDII